MLPKLEIDFFLKVTNEPSVSLLIVGIRGINILLFLSHFLFNFLAKIRLFVSFVTMYLPPLTDVSSLSQLMCIKYMLWGREEFPWVQDLNTGCNN